MRNRKLTALILTALLAVLLLSGCGNDEQSPVSPPGEPEPPRPQSVEPVTPTDVGAVLDILGARELSPEAQTICGSWAYIHDTETPALVLSSDGGAIYNGTVYTFDYDGQFIELTAFNGEKTRLRCTADKKGIYLYKKSIYKYTGEGEPDGLVGTWRCDSQKWTYEFTGNGTFVEDGYFPGHYSVDEAASTFKLMYNDHFEDTTCYYSINGSEMTIEYPWRMVQTAQ